MQSITIVKGTTNTFLISIVDASGNPYEMSSSEEMIFGVKSSEYDTEYLLSKTITSADLVDGKYKFKLEPEDTEQLPFGSYLFDVGLQSGSDFYNIIECSRFILDRNITKAVSE